MVTANNNRQAVSRLVRPLVLLLLTYCLSVTFLVGNFGVFTADSTDADAHSTSPGDEGEDTNNNNNNDQATVATAADKPQQFSTVEEITAFLQKTLQGASGSSSNNKKPPHQQQQQQQDSSINVNTDNILELLQNLQARPQGGQAVESTAASQEEALASLGSSEEPQQQRHSSQQQQQHSSSRDEDDEHLSSGGAGKKTPSSARLSRGDSFLWHPYPAPWGSLADRETPKSFVTGHNVQRLNMTSIASVTPQTWSRMTHSTESLILLYRQWDASLAEYFAALNRLTDDGGLLVRHPVSLRNYLALAGTSRDEEGQAAELAANSRTKKTACSSSSDDDDEEEEVHCKSDDVGEQGEERAVEDATREQVNNQDNSCRCEASSINNNKNDNANKDSAAPLPTTIVGTTQHVQKLAIDVSAFPNFIALSHSLTTPSLVFVTRDLRAFDIPPTVNAVSGGVQNVLLQHSNELRVVTSYFQLHTILNSYEEVLVLFTNNSPDIIAVERRGDDASAAAAAAAAAAGGASKQEEKTGRKKKKPRRTPQEQQEDEPAAAQDAIPWSCAMKLRSFDAVDWNSPAINLACGDPLRRQLAKANTPVVLVARSVMSDEIPQMWDLKKQQQSGADAATRFFYSNRDDLASFSTSSASKSHPSASSVIVEDLVLFRKFYHGNGSFLGLHETHVFDLPLRADVSGLSAAEGADSFDFEQPKSLPKSLEQVNEKRIVWMERVGDYISEWLMLLAGDPFVHELSPANLPPLVKRATRAAEAPGAAFTLLLLDHNKHSEAATTTAARGGGGSHHQQEQERRHSRHAWFEHEDVCVALLRRASYRSRQQRRRQQKDGEGEGATATRRKAAASPMVFAFVDGNRFHQFSQRLRSVANQLQQQSTESISKSSNEGKRGGCTYYHLLLDSSNTLFHAPVASDAIAVTSIGISGIDAKSYTEQPTLLVAKMAAVLPRSVTTVKRLIAARKRRRAKKFVQLPHQGAAPSSTKKEKEEKDEKGGEAELSLLEDFLCTNIAMAKSTTNDGAAWWPGGVNWRRQAEQQRYTASDVLAAASTSTSTSSEDIRNSNSNDDATMNEQQQNYWWSSAAPWSIIHSIAAPTTPASGRPTSTPDAVADEQHRNRDNNDDVSDDEDDMLLLPDFCNKNQQHQQRQQGREGLMYVYDGTAGLNAHVLAVTIPQVTRQLPPRKIPFEVELFDVSAHATFHHHEHERENRHTTAMRKSRGEIIMATLFSRRSGEGGEGGRGAERGAAPLVHRLPQFLFVNSSHIVSYNGIDHSSSGVLSFLASWQGGGRRDVAEVAAVETTTSSSSREIDDVSAAAAAADDEAEKRKDHYGEENRRKRRMRCKLWNAGDCAAQRMTAQTHF